MIAHGKAIRLVQQCKWLCIGAVLVTLVGAGGSAHAGLFDDEEARRAILDLRQKNEVLNDKLNQESARASDEISQLRRSLLDLQSQLDALKMDAAKLRGQNEQLARDLAETQRKQKDTEERLRKLEPMRVSLDGKEFIADPAEKRDYERVLAIYRKGDFPNATTGFVDFLNRNPQTGYRASALFLLGNAQYATKDYKNAVANFRALATQFADDSRVPEALLAIANCQTETKDAKGAKKTLEELVANYPRSEAAGVAKDRLAKSK